MVEITRKMGADASFSGLDYWVKRYTFQYGTQKLEFKLIGTSICSMRLLQGISFTDTSVDIASMFNPEIISSKLVTAFKDWRNSDTPLSGYTLVTGQNSIGYGQKSAIELLLKLGFEKEVAFGKKGMKNSNLYVLHTDPQT